MLLDDAFPQRIHSSAMNDSWLALIICHASTHQGLVHAYILFLKVSLPDQVLVLYERALPWVGPLVIILVILTWDLKEVSCTLHTRTNWIENQAIPHNFIYNFPNFDFKHIFQNIISSWNGVILKLIDSISALLNNVGYKLLRHRLYHSFLNDFDCLIDLIFFIYLNHWFTYDMAVHLFDIEFIYKRIANVLSDLVLRLLFVWYSYLI